VKRGASDIHIEPYEMESACASAWTALQRNDPPLRLKDAITAA